GPAPVGKAERVGVDEPPAGEDPLAYHRVPENAGVAEESAPPGHQQPKPQGQENGRLRPPKPPGAAGVGFTAVRPFPFAGAPDAPAQHGLALRGLAAGAARLSGFRDEQVVIPDAPLEAVGVPNGVRPLGPEVEPGT